LEATPEFGRKSHDIADGESLYVFGTNLIAKAAYFLPPPFPPSIYV
jgi:hypothetical protein